jgi:exopolyphosphatase / guanosine-5'-triphosphate,3'-diphosphate pyrophosphatase
LATHEGYSTLDRNSRIVVSKLAAILRVAIALDASRSSRIKEVLCQKQRGNLIIQLPGVTDASLEELALRQTVTLFEEVFGRSVRLRPVAKTV